jgi:hypothetical protein
MMNKCRVNASSSEAANILSFESGVRLQQGSQWRMKSCELLASSGWEAY